MADQMWGDEHADACDYGDSAEEDFPEVQAQSAMTEAAREAALAAERHAAELQVMRDNNRSHNERAEKRARKGPRGSVAAALAAGPPHQAKKAP